MVILSVHNTSDIYGASQSMLRVLCRLKLDGHSVHVVLAAPGPLVELLEAHGVTVHIFESLAIVERQQLGSLGGKIAFYCRYLYSALWLSVLILRLKVDVVHTNTAVMPAPAIAAWMTRRRHLWHMREFFSEFPGAWKYYQRYIWRFSERIITNSDAVRDQFDIELRSKCITVYNSLGPGAADIDREAARRFRESVGNPALLIGVIGRIKWVRKGQEILIKAAALLGERYPEARYVIVGSVSAGNEDHLLRLKELIAEVGLTEKVVFTGDIENPRDVYAALDVTVVPSVLPEPFGRVVMESMAAGTPVVASRCGGIPEQISDGETGLLFEPGNARELAAALQRLMSDGELRARMSRAARERALRMFDDSATYASMARVFAGEATSKGQSEEWPPRDPSVMANVQNPPQPLPQNASSKHRNIVILSVHNTSDIYGASRCLHRTLEPFARSGHKIHVVMPADGPLTELLQNSGIKVHIFPFLAVIERLNLASLRGKIAFCFHFWFSVCWLIILIVKLNVDVVHTNTAVLPAPALATTLTRRRHLWHIREFFSEYPRLWKHYQKYIWRFSDKIITISSAVQRQFEPPFQEKCTLVYDALDDAAASVDIESAHCFRASVGNPKFLVGVVGRIKWVRKGQEVLIRAAAILAEEHPQARYVIVGSAAPGNEDHLIRLQQLIKDFQLEEKIAFTGDIPNVRDVYAALDVTVVPSILPEPFGCVVMESMAAGTPVVASRCGGIPEQISDGETGLLFEPGNERELAAALQKLMSDGELRARLSRAARERALRMFDGSATFASMANVFAGRTV